MSGNDACKDFFLDKFSSMDDIISAKRMFGGYVFHMAGKVLGFVFEGEFLFEPGPTIDRLLPDAQRRELFPGSKLFIVMDESIGAQSLCALARECYDDLPISKPRKKKNQSGKQEQERQKEIERKFPFSKLIP